MRFRTRTQEVEAIEYTGDNAAEVMSVCATASAHSDGQGNEWIEVLDRFKRRMKVSSPVILAYATREPAGWYIADRDWFERTFPIPVPNLVRTVGDYEGLPERTILEVVEEGGSWPTFCVGRILQIEGGNISPIGWNSSDRPADIAGSGTVCSVVRLGGERHA